MLQILQNLSNGKTSFLPVQHPNRMLSLDNAFSHEDMRKFIEKIINLTLVLVL